jgi:hypothetical protein
MFLQLMFVSNALRRDFKASRELPQVNNRSNGIKYCIRGTMARRRFDENVVLLHYY